MDVFSVRQIGAIRVGEDGTQIVLLPEYAPALRGLQGFEYIQVLWWFDGCDNVASRAKLKEKSPYTKGPDDLGVFATRSPERPNPLALSCAYVTDLDTERGIIWIGYIDAEDESPVLDIKPYTPSLDRVERPGLPDWCAHWPDCVERSGDFDWESEFNFSF